MSFSLSVSYFNNLFFWYNHNLENIKELYSHFLSIFKILNICISVKEKNLFKK